VRPASPAWLAVAATLGVLLCPAPCAAARTDMVRLRSGDQITVEIKELQFGYLDVETDSLGTLSVVWQDVVELTSTYRFVVEVSSGQRYVGTLSSPVPGKLQVGAGPALLDLSAVVSIRSDRTSLFDRIDGSLEVNFNLARANSQKQWSLDSKVRYSGLRWFHVASGSSSFTSQEGSNNTSRNNFTLQSGRVLANRWYYAGLFQAQQDQELGLDRRVSAGGGIGRQLIQSNRRDLELLGGILVTTERFEDVPGTQTNMESLMLWRYESFRRRSPKLDTSVTYILLPSLTDIGRVRSEVDFSTSIEVIHNFFVGLTGFDTYDSRPPDPALPRNDYGVSPSVRWKF